MMIADGRPPHCPQDEIRGGLSRGLSRTRMTRRSFVQRGQIEEVTGGPGHSQHVESRLPYRTATAAVVRHITQSDRIVIPHRQCQFVSFEVHAPVVVSHDRHVDHRLLVFPGLLRLYPMHLVARAVRPAGPIDGANPVVGHRTTP